MRAYSSIDNMHNKISPFVTGLLAFAIYCSVFAHSLSYKAQAQVDEQSSVGVFQFVATTIDVVGLEDDVSYIVRNELRKAPNIVVINQRELEIALSRNDIQQTYNADEAVKAASVMNLNYVIIGRVSRDGQQIVANVDLVSPIDAASVGSLKFTFNNQAQIALQSTYIGESLAQAIAEHKVDTKAAVKSLGDDWVDTISANYANGLVTVNWQMTDPTTSFLGFNIYRATNEQGPFSYIASEAEFSTKDNPGTEAATYFYQVSMINDEGEEVRSEQLASVRVEEVKLSSLNAPTIVDITERVSGIELGFFPSSENVGKPIVGYELIRRSDSEDWQVVNTYLLPTQNNSQSSNNTKSIKKYVISDPTANNIAGSVSYAVRAYSTEEKGQATNAIDYTPASAPSLRLVSNNTLREIEISWTPASAGFGYNIYRKVENGQDWELLQKVTGLSNTTYNDTQIDAESLSFEYAISVYDDFGETPKSEPLIAQSKAALAPPSQVAGVSGLARKATISWQGITDPDATGYSVFRAPYTEDAEFTLTRIGEINDPLATSFTDESNLADNTAYYYSVASINRFNVSGPVSQAVLITTKAPPLPVTDLRSALVINDASDNSITLNWAIPPENDLSDLAKVQIERSFNGVDFSKLAQVDPTQNTFKDTLLLAGAQQSYRVMLIDQDTLMSEATRTEPVTVDLPLVLSVPTDGMLRKISLAWENALLPAYIKVFRGTEENALNLVKEVTEYETPAFIDEYDLIDDQTYYVKVESWLGSQKLAESNIVTSTTKDIPAPQNLTAESNLPRQIKLTWEPVNDESITKYVIFRRLANSSESENGQLVSIAQTDSADVNEFVDTVGKAPTTEGAQAIDHGFEYEYAIASKNVFDATGYVGNIVSASSKKLPSPASAVQVESDEESIKLSWQVGAETDLSELVVERKWPFEDAFTEISRVSASTLEFVDNNLYPYASPEYRLSVIDADGLVSPFTQVEKVDNIKAITANVQQDKLLREIQIGWDRAVKDVSVVIKRRKAGEKQFQALATVPSEALSYTDKSGLVDQTNYEYQLSVQTSSEQAYELGTSNIINADTKPLPTAPLLSATSGLVKQVALSWEVANDADVGGYKLYKVSDSGQLDELESFKRNENTYIDDGSFFSKLDDGATYNYKLAAFNTYNVEGLPGELTSASTKSLPSAPQSVNAQISGDSVSIAWMASAENDVVTYEVLRGSSCSRVSVIGRVNSTTNLSYLDGSAKQGRDYCYKVKAVDADKLESALSQGAQITMPEASE